MTTERPFVDVLPRCDHRRARFFTNGDGVPRMDCACGEHGIIRRIHAEHVTILPDFVSQSPLPMCRYCGVRTVTRKHAQRCHLCPSIRSKRIRMEVEE